MRKCDGRKKKERVRDAPVNEEDVVCAAEFIVWWLLAPSLLSLLHTHSQLMVSAICWHPHAQAIAVYSTRYTSNFGWFSLVTTNSELGKHLYHFWQYYCQLAMTIPDAVTSATASDTTPGHLANFSSQQAWTLQLVRSTSHGHWKTFRNLHQWGRGAKDCVSSPVRNFRTWCVMSSSSYRLYANGSTGTPSAHLWHIMISFIIELV